LGKKRGEGVLETLAVVGIENLRREEEKRKK